MGYRLRGTGIGPASLKWKGGRVTRRGYICIWLPSDDFFYPMVMSARKPYVVEHRLVMARYLGRCLQSCELVHHKNHIKNDNRLENLELTTWSEHGRIHAKGYYSNAYTRGFKDGQTKQIEELRDLIEGQGKEIRLLRWELTEKDKVG